MEKIHTIDLWTEQYVNHQECFNGAFIDGFENGKIAFDQYKVVKNCNCLITVNNLEVHICNKHNAIVFYQENKPVRLIKKKKKTDIERCIECALEQSLKDKKLSEVYRELGILVRIIDLKEKPIDNQANRTKEIDTGSCDRWNLLYSMLKGSYTECDTGYGKNGLNQYEFLSDIEINYELKTDTEEFEIQHKCGFINEKKNRIIIIQENSPLTQNVSRTSY